MKIIQISDLHINSIDEKSEVNVRLNFTKLIEELKTITFDYLVITGDLCLSEGDVDTYNWIKNYIESLKKPYYIISGNHDNNKMISSVYKIDSIDGFIYYSLQLEEKTLYFLDTSSEFLSINQIEWLNRSLKNGDDKSPIIFIHHPPIKTGVRYMDEHHALKNVEETSLLFNEFEYIKFNIFCGHFHTEKEIRSNNVNLYITPSNFLNVNNEMEVLKIENSYASYRIINLKKGDIRTSVHYIE